MILIASSFAVWFRALLERVKNRRFFRSDFLADKNQLRPIGIERLQVPAASDEIEKLRAILEANEALRPKNARGQSVRETFEAIAGESFVRTECERLELWLMFMLGRRDLFLQATAGCQTKVRDRSGSALCE